MSNNFNIAAALSTLRRDKPDDFHGIFFEAIYSDNIAAVTQLLNAGADLNAVNKFGNTARHWAACNGRNEIARLLADKGAKLDVQDNPGNAALDWAKRNGHTAIGKLLLRKDAGLNARNRGNTARHFAAHNGHTEIAKLQEAASVRIEAQRPQADSIEAIRTALGLK